MSAAYILGSGSGGGGSGTVTSINASGGTTGLTFSGGPVTTSGTLTMAGLLIGANGGTGVANTGKTITLGGNLVTSGAFALTLTLTNTTGVTLPTTGTLATLAGAEALTNKSVNGVTLAGTGTLTIGGNFTTSGAFTTTLTVTANTAVTLPTTGTLATLAGAEALTNKSVNAVTLVSGGTATLYLSQDGTYTTPTGTVLGANPTASVGLAAVNGSATTYLRSDGAPALDQSIAPTMTGLWNFSNTTDSTTSTSNSAIKTAGGISVAKAVFVGTTITAGGNITAGATSVFQFAGNAGFQGAATNRISFISNGGGSGFGIITNTADTMRVRTLDNTADGAIQCSSLTATAAISGAGITSSTTGLFQSTTDATTTSTGSLITSGGLGVAKALWVGGLANIAGTLTLPKTGAASAPAMVVSGVPFAGTGTTSFPQLYINDTAATASTTLTTAGTYLGVNGHGTADLMNLMLDGVSKVKISSAGILTSVNDITTTGTVTLGVGQKLVWSTRSALQSTANGKLSLGNTGITTGVVLDFVTADTLKVRNLADNADGALTAGAITASGQLIGGGTATNNSAAAGVIGEYASSLIASGSAVALTTATTANVTSISLTAGDWDVSGAVSYNETGATTTARSAGITSTSATVPSDGSEGYCGVQSTLTSEINSIPVARKRFSLSGTTTVYLVALAAFSAGTVGAFGVITARRVR